MTRSHHLTLRIAIPLIATVILFTILIPLVLFSAFCDYRNADGHIADGSMATLKQAYIIISSVTIVGLSGLITYVYRVEMRIKQAYTTFERRIEEQANQLTLFNDVFTREVADHKREQLEFQLINRIFEHSLEGIIITDSQADILKINPAFTTITGYTEEESIGKNPRILNAGIHAKPFYEGLWKSLKKTGRWENEIWNRRKNGEAYPQWLSISAIKSEQGTITHYIGVFHDITDLKLSQRQIAHQAYHDALTDLPNRQLFRDHLEMAFANAQRHQHDVGVMFLDIDKFKNINDTLGYTVGDFWLQEVAKRLKKCCRNVDTVARLGGDEFMIILPELTPYKHDVIDVAERILKSLSAPFIVKGHEILSSVSIGITMYPRDGEDVATLERNADIATNLAKEQGRNTYTLYTKTMRDSVLERLELERNLRNAFKHEEFKVHYQPQVDIKSGRIVGMEALVRWQRSKHELVSPDRFIPLAEETGLIVPLGEWVLRTACRQVKVWHNNGFHALSVSINLSAKQFQDEQLIRLVRDVLRETRLAPEFLCLEITESTVMGDMQKAINMMLALRDIGVRLSIDDFGTGYSSLNYLKSFPLNEIKIDKSFVKDIPCHRDDVAIAKAIFTLAHHLNMKVLAEGVETPVQLEFMRENHCDGMQGYLFSKPVNSDDFTRLLQEGKRLEPKIQ